VWLRLLLVSTLTIMAGSRSWACTAVAQRREAAVLAISIPVWVASVDPGERLSPVRAVSTVASPGSPY
jgi:hypothetical protein